MAKKRQSEENKNPNLMTKREYLQQRRQQEQQRASGTMTKAEYLREREEKQRQAQPGPFEQIGNIFRDYVERNRQQAMRDQFTQEFTQADRQNRQNQRMYGNQTVRTGAQQMMGSLAARKAEAEADRSPMEQYRNLPESEKAQWWSGNKGQSVKSILSDKEARKYVDSHLPDIEGVQTQKKYWQGQLDKANATDRAEAERLAGITQEERKQAGQEAWNLKGQLGVYTQLDTQGLEIPGNESMGTRTFTTRKRPEDYFDTYGNYSDRATYYDSILYDKIHGAGAYNDIYENGTDEEYDRMDAEVENLWNRLEKGTLHEIADQMPITQRTMQEKELTARGQSTDQLAAQSQARYAQEQLDSLNKLEKEYTGYYDYMGRYETPAEAGYNPENDRYNLSKEWNKQEAPLFRDGKDGKKYIDPVVRESFKQGNVHQIYSFINEGAVYSAWLNTVGDGEVTDDFRATWMMNDTERRIFNNFYNNDKYDEASAFIDGLQPYLKSRYTEYETIKKTEAARQYKILASGQSLIDQASDVFVAPVRTVAGWLGDESVKDKTSDWYKATNEGQLYQNAVMESLPKPIQKTYGVVMNSLRNVINGLLTKGAGLAGWQQKAASLLSFGSQIYQESTFKYLDETGDYDKAQGLALLDAVMETAEEMLPYEAMLGDSTRPIMYFVKNALSEAGEEFTGATIGEKIKGLITGKDNVQQRADQIFNEGGFTDRNGNWVAIDTRDRQKALNQADYQALVEWGDEIKENTIAGAAGGGMGSVYAIGANVMDRYSTGRTVNARNNTEGGKTGAERIVELAKGMKEGTESRKQAEQISQQMEKGSKPGNYEIGKLAQTIMQETGEQQKQVISKIAEEDIRGQLESRGVEAEAAQKFAEIIRKSVTEGSLTLMERSALARDARAIDVWKTYNTMSKAAVELAKKIPEAVKDQTSIAEAVGELVSSRTVSGSAAAMEIERSIKETNSTAEAIDNLASRRSDLMSEEYAEEAKAVLEATGEKTTKNFLDDAMKIRMAAMTLNTMPQVKIREEAAQRLFNKAQEEFNRIDAERVIDQKQVKPGEGKAVFDGAEYGTTEWVDKVKDLTKRQRNQMGALGEIATRAGLNVRFINDTENTNIYGFEDNSGLITINVAGMNRGGMGHHMLVTMSHEMTHWLEQNSREGYNALRKYIVDGLRAKGENVEEMIVRTIDNQNAVLGAESGQSLTINGAMAELVAKSCENLLSSESMMKALQQENPSVYSKIKTFVKDFTARIRQAVEGMTGSLSREARTLLNETEKIADLWLGAREEALGRKEGGRQAEEGVSFSVEQMDEEYRQAVESGNTEEQRRLVEQAAKAAGYKNHLYHGTNSFGFTQIDNNAPGADGFSFWATDNPDAASTYTRFGNVRPVNSEISSEEIESIKREVSDKMDDAISEFRHLIDHTFSEWYFGMEGNSMIRDAVDEANHEPGHGDGVYDVLEEYVYDAFDSYGEYLDNEYDDVGEWMEESEEGQAIADAIVNIEAIRSQINELENGDINGGIYDLYANTDNFYVIDAEGKTWNQLRPEGLPNITRYGQDNATYRTRDVANWARENGYDGVHFKNILDNGAYGRTGPIDVYAFFNPQSQVKSADTITYNDNGNVIPLSERFNEQQKDIRFSMAEPVEERADGLIAVHNLRENDLNNVLKLGGFAMPSIAIVKSSEGHSEYGDISVVFYPDTINPRAYRTNKVYGGDAWTPTYPSVEYKINTKELNKVVKELTQGIDRELLNGLDNVELYEDNLERSINGARGDIARALQDNSLLKYAYAKEKGIDIDIPMNEESLDGSKEFDNAVIIRIANMLGKDVVEEAQHGGYRYFENNPEQQERIRQAVNDNYNKRFGTKEKDPELKHLFSKGLYSKDNFGFNQINRIINAAFRYFKQGVKQEVSKGGLRKELEGKLDQKDYENWVKSKLSNIIEKSGIRNNKDLFTDYGNRRSWEALHDEETLDNVVRIMRAQDSKGEAAFFNQSALLALGTRNFTSLEDIRKHSDQLQHMSEEEYKAAKDKIADEFGDIVTGIYNKSASSNPFTARDRAYDAIVEAVKKSKTVQGIDRELREWQGLNIKDDTAERIVKAMEEIANLPTEYFEAKPQRAVGIDEIARVILPEDSSEELKKALDNWGVEYETYNGTDEDRLAKLNAVPNVQFSISESPDMEVNNFMMGLQEFNLATEQEKTMLRQYKGLKGDIEIVKMAISENEKKRAELMAKGRLNAEDQEKVNAINQQIKDRKAEGEKAQRSLIDENNKLTQEKWAIQKEKRLTNEERDRLKEINKTIQQNNEKVAEIGYKLAQEVKKLTAQRAELQKGSTLSPYDRDQMIRANNRLVNDRNKLERLEREMARVTSDEGYAKLMYRQDSLMKNLVSGRTAGQLQQTVDAISREMDTVDRQMAERSERLKRLAGSEAVLRIRQQFNRAGLKGIAAELKSEMQSGLENREIENRLALIALKMKQGEMDTDTVSELADLLAGRMKSDYDSYIISELRGRTISLSNSQMKELKATNSSLREIQQELAGTGIRITAKGGTTLDQAWGQLCDLIPSLDRDASDKDMLNGLMDVIRSEKANVPAIFTDENMMKISESILKAAQKLIPEITTDAKSLNAMQETLKFVSAVSGEAKATAEAMEDIRKMIERLKRTGEQAKAEAGTLTGDVGEMIEYFDTLSKQSEAAMWKRDRRALIDQLTSENTQNLLKEQEKWKQKIEKDKNAREMMAGNQKLRQRITTNVSRVRKLLVNETDLKNVPEHMKSLAREMISRIVENDLTGRKITGIDRKDLIETNRILKAMGEQDGDFTLNDLKMLNDEEAQALVADALADIEDGIGFYNNRPDNDLMANLKGYRNALEKISDAVSVITSVINAERNISFLDRTIPLADAAEDIRKEMAKSRFKGEWAGRGHGAITAARQAVIYGNTTPVYFFKNLMNRAMDEQWKDMQAGENRSGLETQKAKDYLGTVAAETNYRNWADQTHEVTLGGQKRTVTIENMMELYAIWKREQTSNPEMSQHLAQGGVFIREDSENEGFLRRENKQQRAFRVTDAEIMQMYDQMTEEQKQYIERIVSYLSNEMSELGNEASMRMYGIRKYKETYYFPMKVWDGVKSARSDKGITGTDENRAAHRSWSKRRQHMARNALVIGNFTQDAVNHIVEMINYNTMAPAIENMNKILNYQFTEGEDAETETKRNMRMLFQEAYGRDALNYLETFMKDLNGGVTQDQRKTMRDRLLTVFKKNAVAGSMSVALQQPLSYIRAAMMISPKYLAVGPVRQNWKDSYKEMMKYSGVAVIKGMGRFDMNFGASAKEYITPETKKSAYEWTTDKLTAAPELMDRMTWIWMWNAVKAEQAAKHPQADPKSERFMVQVANRFNELMRRTQVYDSVMVKSSNMRSQKWEMKLLTSFMAEPTLSLNVLADAVRNARQEGGKGTLARAGATFVMSAAMQAVVKGLMGAGRSPDDKKNKEENFLNKFFQNLISEVNPLSLVPGYSDLIEVLKTGELKDDAMGALGKLFSIVQTGQKIVNGKGQGAYRDLEDTVAQLAQMFTNVPAKNLMRDARAMYNWFINPTAYADRETSGAVLKYQAEASWINRDTILGTINTWLGEAGMKTTNSSYYRRMYDAMQAGDTGTADELKEYMLLGKGVKEDTVKAGLKTAAKNDQSRTDAEKDQWMIDSGLLDDIGTVTEQYKDGKITANEARKLWKQMKPDMTEDDMWWKLDRVDWKKETGEDTSSYDYRLNAAMISNRSEDIKKAVDGMMKHGRTQKQVKDSISSRWKSQYLAADSAGRVKIRDAMQKAYKAAGLTAKDADNTIEGWKKDAEKNKKK